MRGQNAPPLYLSDTPRVVARYPLMTPLFQSLAQHSGEILLALLVSTGVLAAIAAVLAIRLAKIRSRWSQLLDGVQGETIERLLYDHLRERMSLQEEVRVLSARVETLEQKALQAKRHLGLIRYDAFEDVGGSQSFALALYDDQGNGAILSSLVGRADCRVYCKPLLGGSSERSLSQEEQRAIQEAKSRGPKSIVSH